MPRKPKIVTATVNGQRLTIEVVSRSEDRKKGLSGRHDIPIGTGMLFVFPLKGRHSFWMKDTYLHLAIYWLNDSGYVVSKTHMPAEALQRHWPSEPVRYAVEVPLTWAVANNVRIGDRFYFKR